MDSKGTAVVWTPPDAEPPEELTAALQRGGLNIQRVTSPYMALAHLCTLERSHPADARSASGALVLVGPERLSHPGQVCDAASRFAPHSRSWMYSSGSQQRLRSVTQNDVDGWLKAPGSLEASPVIVKATSPKPGGPAATPISLRPGSRTSPTPAAAPKLRLAGDPKVQQGAESADLQNGEREPARPRQVLTPEELEMLLDEPTP